MGLLNICATGASGLATDSRGAAGALNPGTLNTFDRNDLSMSENMTTTSLLVINANDVFINNKRMTTSCAMNLAVELMLCFDGGDSTFSVQFSI